MWQPFRRLSSFRPWPPAEEEQKIIGSSKFLILVCVWHLSRVLGRSSSAQNWLLLSRWVINLLFCVCERVSCQSLCIMSDNINTWGYATLPSVGPMLSLNSRMPTQWPALKKRVLIVGSSHARRLDRFMGSENGKARPAVRPHFGVGAAEVRVYGRDGMRVYGLLAEDTCREFESFQPHVAILLIGGNDFLSIGDSDLIAHRLVAVAATLKRRFGLEHVFITQILPRFIRPRHNGRMAEWHVPAMKKCSTKLHK